MVSGDFVCSVIILFFWCPVICQFSKHSLFQKKGCIFCLFFKFRDFKFNFGKISFLGLLKHYKNGGLSQILCFPCWRRKSQPKTMISGISVFLCPKMAVSWRTSVCQKRLCWNPYFYSVFFGCAFVGQVVKKGKFWTHTKKRKNWLITEKLFFGYFYVFKLFCLGEFKGQVRWPERPPHLDLNPPH